MFTMDVKQQYNNNDGLHLKEIQEQILSFKCRFYFKKSVTKERSSREANRNSQKLFPFVIKMMENHGGVSKGVPIETVVMAPVRK